MRVENDKGARPTRAGADLALNYPRTDVVLDGTRMLAALIQIVAHELEHFGQLSAAISAEVKRGELRRFYVKQIESTNNRGVRGWPFSMRLARRLAISVPCSYRCVANECLRTCGDTRFSIPMASAVSRTTL